MNKTCSECVHGQWANAEGVEVCEACVNMDKFKQFRTWLLPVVKGPGEEGVE
jgi:disulfide oxidoreductase YuzD